MRYDHKEAQRNEGQERMTDRITEIRERHDARMKAFTDLGMIMGSFEPHGIGGGGEFRAVHGKTPDDDIARLLDQIAERDAEIERFEAVKAELFKQDAELRNALADAHCVFDLGRTKWWEAYGHLLEASHDQHD